MANQVTTLDTRYYSLYIITNQINGKSYIGITSQKPYKRWRCHCSEKSSSMTVIKQAILKYGRDNFEFKVIETFKNKNKLKAAEKKFIIKYNTLSPNGYNLNTGGDMPTMTIEAKKRMSIARLKYFDKIGRLTHSLEYVRKRDEFYRRRRGIQSRNEAWNNEERRIKARDRMIGFTHTSESKAKIALSKKRAVIRSDGKVFDSIESAAMSVNRNNVSIWRVLQGNLGRKTSGGYGWKYINNI